MTVNETRPVALVWILAMTPESKRFKPLTCPYNAPIALSILLGTEVEKKERKWLVIFYVLN